MAGVAAAIAFMPAVAQAQAQARIYGRILDAAGKPVPGVTITITEPTSTTFKLEAKSDEEGKYAVLLVDSTRSYVYQLEKEGYQTKQETYKAPLGGNTEKDFTIVSEEVAAQQAPPGGGPSAVAVYNAGAEAARQGDLATARAKFEEALAMNDELSPAWLGLAIVHAKQADYKAAAEAAEKAVALDPGNVGALTVRWEAYKELGDEKKTQEAYAALTAAAPERGASDQFEEALALFNAGKVAESLPLLQKVIAERPDHGKAHYLLGIAYVNAGQNDLARTHLQKFLELAPDDPDAAAAKEMLQFLE
jgi:tetratricopeptide (TPR) repeat protein